MIAPATPVARIVGRRLGTLQRTSGLPMVFGGAITGGSRGGRSLVLSEFHGTHTGALAGLEVASCAGLGGRAVDSGCPQVVTDYRSSRMITHEYDHKVVEQEKLTSIFALPVVNTGRVIAVIYGASRAGPIGDIALNRGAALAEKIRQDYRALVPVGPESASIGSAAEAVRAIDGLLRNIPNPALRHRLAAIRRFVGSGLDSAGPVVLLAPREIDVLRLVALGRTNVEIADELGLGVQTVKSYLRTAMRKLAATNRTAAAHHARAAGLI